MPNVNSEFIERFQLEYEKNPRSRVFAALAEAYRKMGLLEEANRLCVRGVQIHPNFAGGRVAFAKVLIDLKQTEKALEQLEKAVASSPENLLAHSLMGETLLQMRRPKDALKAYKMVLFLNPNDEKAKSVVGKWEFLSADEYDDELFAMKPVFRLGKISAEDAPVLNPIAAFSGVSVETLQKDRALERAVSLADALTVRGEPERALAILQEARNRVGTTAEIDKRFALLSKRAKAPPPEPSVEIDDVLMGTEDSEMDVSSDFSALTLASPEASRIANYGVDPRERVRLKLETFLRRIEARRSSS